MTVSVSTPVLSINEAAAYLRASRGHIYNLLRQGDLLPVKVGGRTLIRRSDIDDLLERSIAPFQARVRKTAGHAKPDRAPAGMGIFG